MTDSATLALTDGRVLSFADQGAETDPVVRFIPGFGHSRLAHALIAVDLPGIGRSTANPSYNLRGWAQDVCQLLDALGVARCGVLGWSWGGPYALSLGHSAGDRISAIGLVSALTGWLAGPGREHEVKPQFRTFGLWCRYTPFATKLFLRSQGRTFLADPAKSMARDYRDVPAADKHVMDDPQLRQMLLNSQHEAWVNGPAGMYDHSRAVALPWGFDPGEVTAPIQIWQGGADPEIRPAMAVDFAKRSGGNLRVDRDAGHLLVFSEWADIIGRLTVST